MTVYETGWSVLPAFQGRGVATVATAQCIERAAAQQKHKYLHAYPGVAPLPLGDLGQRLGPAEVLRHRRVSEQLLQEREVAVGPRLDPDLAQSISFLVIATIAIRHKTTAKSTR